MIYVDMDGVLADFQRRSFEIMGFDYDACDKNLLRYDFWLDRGYTTDEFFELVESYGEEFWETLPAFPWVDDLIAEVEWAVRRMGMDGWAVLTSPTNCPHSHSGKARWLKNKFGRGFRDYCIVPAKHKKRLAAGNILIDDCDPNCEQWEAAGGTPVLFPQPWNKNHQFHNVQYEYAGMKIISIANGFMQR